VSEFVPKLIVGSGKSWHGTARPY